MNLACNISDFEIDNTCFLDIKKNIIIDGTFTKLVYSTTNVIFNGIYLLFPIIRTTNEDKKNIICKINYKKTSETETRNNNWQRCDSSDGRSKVSHLTISGRDSLIPNYKIGGKYIISTFSVLNQFNIHNIKELSRIEHDIIEYAKEYYNINKMNIYSLRNQLKQGSIKIYNSIDQIHLPSNTDNIILKISGIWENEVNIGITYKFLNL